MAVYHTGVWRRWIETIGAFTDLGCSLPAHSPLLLLLHPSYCCAITVAAAAAAAATVLDKVERLIK